MEIILRATAVYFLLFAVTRGVGKRELSEMTAFELILIVTMGDLIQQGVTEEDMSVTGAVLAVGTLTFWIVVIAYLTFRFKRLRPPLEGLPVVILRDGRPLLDIMRVERLTVEELEEAARGHGIADLETVDLAVLEPDGKFSFLADIDQDDTAASEKHTT
ncbi:MAG TPA: YetF domain-containing protein [Acidimicrobiales bacterium]|jgi:uncharacterized membrane protein YcaP (DUF421 family)|nr:YetF domain-containing protein [Acidimicrobiales bacterium]